MKASLEDIARELGVSKTLVSLVLNGHAEAYRINKKMAKKVWALAEELGYEPNQLARSLRTGKTNTIGLIVSDIANPLFALLGRYIVDEAAKDNYSVIFTSSDENSVKTTNLVKLLVNRHPDGLLVVPSEDNQKTVLWLKENKIPFVLIDRYYPKIKSNYVVSENYKGSIQAVNHFFEAGYKKIGFVGFDWNLINYKKRYEGYADTMKALGLKVDPKWVVKVSFDYYEQSLLEHFRQMIENNRLPRALLLANNDLCRAVLKILKAVKLRIPHDVALVTFDDEPAFELSDPPITVIRQPFKNIAKAAVAQLINEIENDKGPSNNQQLKLETELIIRQSTEFTNF